MKISKEQFWTTIHPMICGLLASAGLFFAEKKNPLVGFSASILIILFGYWTFNHFYINRKYGSRNE